MNIRVNYWIERINKAILDLLVALDVIVVEDTSIYPVLTAGFIQAGGKDGIKIPVRKMVKEGTVYWRPNTKILGIPPSIMASSHIKAYNVLSEQVGSLPILDNNSGFLTQWGLLVLLVLCFTAFATPIEVAFVTEEKIDLVFLMNRLVDLIFFCDICIQFLTAYEDPKSDKVIRNHFQIATHYVSTWFFIDVISTVPFEIIGLFLQTSKDLSILQILKILRLIRLLKLLRLLRANRKLKLLRLRLNITDDAVEKITFLLSFVMLANVYACGFKFFGDSSILGLSDPGWVDNYQAIHPGISRLNLYALSLYWSFSTCTLQSTYDPLISPASIREYVYCILVKFAAIIFIIMVITAVAATSVHRKEDDIKHEMKIDRYRDLFRTLKLSKRHQQRVNVYWNEYRTVKHIADFDKHLIELPDSIRSMISIELFAPHLVNVPYIANHIKSDISFLLELSLSMRIRAYSPNEALFHDGPDGVYFIQKGIVAWNDQVYLHGDPFGRDCLRKGLPKTRGVALTFVTAYMLPVEALKTSLSKRAWVEEEARKWTFRRSVQKYIRTYAKLYKMYTRRMAREVPPLLSVRPLPHDREMDDIDELVLQDIFENGF